MGRRQINNADYFPHFNSMRNHRKVKMLRNKFGAVLGYAFWSMMLEWLTEHDGIEWEYSEIEIEMFASELGITAAEIPPLVDYCIKIELLSKTDSGFIYSDSLNEYLEPVFAKRQRERVRSKSRKRKEDGTFLVEKPTSSGITAAEIPQSKVEYSKEKNNNIVGLQATPTNGVGVKERAANFVKVFNKIKFENTGKEGKFTLTDKVLKVFCARIKKYDSTKIKTAVTTAFKHTLHKEQNYQYLTPEYILREDSLEKYINMSIHEPTKRGVVT